MVGPWQVPVADAAVTLMDFDGYRGEAMAIGERTPLALIDAPASGRMAVAEAITNIAAAGVARLSDIKLSANWMAPAGHPGEDAALYDTVRAVAMELCPALGISIPGRQGLDVDAHDVARRRRRDKAVTAPVSLIVTAFAPVEDVAPRADAAAAHGLRRHRAASGSISVPGKRRLGGSALAQVYGQLGDVAPDLDDPARLRRVLRGDAGAAAPRAGCSPITTSATAGSSRRCARWRSRRGAASTSRSTRIGADPLALCSPRSRARSCRCASRERAAVIERLAAAGLAVHAIGAPAAHDRIRIARARERRCSTRSRVDLHRAWSATTHALQRLRDNPESADQEYARLLDADGSGHRRRC